MPRIVWRPAALDDLDAIYWFIASDSRRHAAQFVQAIRSRCRMLRDHPRAGRARNDLISGLRVLALREEVLVAYIIIQDEVVIVRMFRGGQDYENILGAAQDD